MDRTAKYLRLLILLATVFPILAFAQDDPRICKFYRPTYLTGSLKLGGHYRYEEGITNDIYNYQKSPRLYGGMAFKSSGYFWHPNLVVLDLGAEYNPMRNQDKFLVVPDQSEARTVKKVDVSASFFSQKPVNIVLFANLDESYTNRENLSDYRLNSTNLGGNLSYSNKVVPIQVRYLYSKWNEREIQTGRKFFNRQQFLQADLKKSFSTRDRNEFRYSHNNFFRQDDTLKAINNISDNFDLMNSVDFDNKRNYTFRSHITGIDQRGYDSFSRVQANEGISLKLPLNFTLSGYYDYFRLKRQTQKSTHNNFGGALDYKLFESLFAKVYFEDNTTNNTFFQEKNTKTGFEIKYIKKIPTNGLITLSYVSSSQRQRRVSDVVRLDVYNEEHTLTDGQIVLLNNGYVYDGTVVVKDATGTVIYQLFFDYNLVKRNNFLEIVRVPGGQIPNGATVFVDYSYLPPGSFQFDAKYRQFAANILLFGRLVEFYFRLANQDYRNLKVTEQVTLNYFTQQIYGGRVEYKFAGAGAEYEFYNSSIIPFRSVRYFVDLQGSIKNRVMFSVNGNWRNNVMLDDNSRQQYLDLNGNVAYQFSPQTKLVIEAGYRKQLGQGIDLDLITGKAELTSTFRQIFVKVGVQVYRRIYLGEQTNFIGGYFEIVRSFTWNRH